MDVIGHANLFEIKAVKPNKPLGSSKPKITVPGLSDGIDAVRRQILPLA
jgi:hypothetical protein